MSKKILLSLSSQQHETLQSLMQSDLATNRTAYIARLIVEEAARRKKPRLGRPSKPRKTASDNYDDDVPKNIPYFGEMIGPREYADKEESREMFAPKS